MTTRQTTIKTGNVMCIVKVVLDSILFNTVSDPFFLLKSINTATIGSMMLKLIILLILLYFSSNIS